MPETIIMAVEAYCCTTARNFLASTNSTAGTTGCHLRDRSCLVLQNCLSCRKIDYILCSAKNFIAVSEPTMAQTASKVDCWSELWAQSFESSLRSFGRRQMELMTA